MNRLLLFYSCLGLVLLTLLSACNDPSTVGIGLIDEQNDPETRTLPLTAFQANEQADLTGNTSRILAGKVEDPLLGSLQASAFMDFDGTFTIDDDTPIVGVSLVLSNDYRYGYTSSNLSLRLRKILATWNANGAESDTTLTLGDEVTTFSFPVSDTLITIPLPAAWVAAHDSTLRRSNFNTLFHGFGIEPLAGEAVVGFRASTSKLRIFTTEDTTDVSMSHRLTHLDRKTPANIPLDRILFQDGAGPVVKVNLALSDASLDETPINGASLRLEVDTLALQQTPAGFVRPLADRLQLVAITKSDLIFTVSEASRTKEGTFVFSDPFSAANPTFRDFLQQAAFTDPSFKHFELRMSAADNSLNAMLFYDRSSPGKAPQVILTVSPVK